MSSLVTQMWLLEQFGPRLSTADLAKVLNLARGTVNNQISAGTFPIATYVDGQRYADYRDVAAHFDKCRELAKEGAA